ncbi:hypothetical protein E0H82_07085 [Acinetobacter sp. ANC 4910]|uniref:FimV/HubP-related protein n=1 Tax=Acinetobacter sp. ANC 4910 TaxID=2529850 RepID=UPI00103B95EB|nr:hypothetical protein [Acinetobacter sp. ANC 4910]TCB35745.1 hypothetical protein E0H82_07085 [Acinetobacter sp. ANC 4910]
MTVYNKLKIAILAIIASQNLHAISIDPLQIQSAPGELLYAEIPFHHAKTDEPVQVSLATPEDINTLGVVHQPPGHLNFFSRQNSSGEGVITITSSRPLTESELNIVVRIQEGNAVHLRHIRTPIQRTAAPKPMFSAKANEKVLSPIMIVSEKDIALNLPTSAQFQPPEAAQLNPMSNSVDSLKLKTIQPPKLATVTDSNEAPIVISSLNTASTPVTPQAKVLAETKTDSAKPTTSVAKNTSTNTENLTTKQSSVPQVQQYQKRAETEKVSAASTQTAASTPKLPAKPKPATIKPAPAAAADVKKVQPNQHTVQNNESLWAIAQRVATEQNRPIGEVMQQIKTQNSHAFIRGDINRLRRGVTLNLQTNTTNKSQQKIVAPPNTMVKQSGKAKYRLNQAEMSLVAEKNPETTNGTAKQKAENEQISNELSLKVMTSREKTVKLQRNVTQLELALRQKDQRIQLLNARLAQLQQQLKAQQAQKKPNS